MSQQYFDFGDTGETAKTVIDDNFVELYGLVEGKVVIQGKVAYFADLPTVADHTNEFWLVTTASGSVITFNRKAAGLYESDGITWSYTGINMSYRLTDSNFILSDDGDDTKRARFEVGGITTGNTRVFSLPDSDGTLALSEDLGNYIPYSGATSDLDLGTNSISNDYITIDNTGLTLFGAARFRQRIKVFTAAELQRGILPPTSGILGNFGFEQYTIGDDSILNVAILGGREFGTDVKVIIRWTTEEVYSVNSGEVQWQLDWSSAPDDGTVDITVPINSGTVLSGDIDLPTVERGIIETTLTIDGTNILNTDELGLKISRVALVDGNDPIVEPGIILVAILAQNNKLGEDI